MALAARLSAATRKASSTRKMAIPNSFELDDNVKHKAKAHSVMGLSPQLLMELQNTGGGRHPYLRLNIGGTSFRMRMETILKRGEAGLLYNFLVVGHENRLRLCDDFCETSREYFFERPAQLFQPIYVYYVTGLKQKPSCLSQELFANELQFWELTQVFLTQTETREPRNQANPFNEVPMGRVRQKIWDLVEEPESSGAARVIAFCSILAVLVSNISLTLATLPELQVNSTRLEDGGNSTEIIVEPHPAFEMVEMACIAFFTVEYLTKIIVAPNRKEVFWKPMNMIDLIAILPFYVELLLMAIGIDSSDIGEFQGAILVVRILRVLRVVRLLKLGRYSTGLQMFVKVLKRSLPQLGMVLIVVAIGVMFFSTLVYFVEKDDSNTKFISIPAAFWWCLVTITTVGYGDMYPQTVAGKLIASMAITCGLLVLSLPITIIVDHFMQVQDEMNLQTANKGKDDM